MKEAQMIIDEVILKPQFKINDEVYLLLVERGDAYIAKGRVKNVYQVDNLNIKYLVQGVTFSIWCYDNKLYADLNELIEDFKSVIRN